jgi:hypothetical protein
MNDLVSKIRNQRFKNLNSILSSFEKSESNEIEKSIIDSLSYNPEIKIEKTGKEIKVNLVLVKSNIEQQKNLHYQNMLAYKKDVNIEPDEQYSYYNENLAGRVNAPKFYSYDQRWGRGEEVKENSSITYPKTEVVVSITKDQKNAMAKYNDCAREYSKCLTDLLTIDTLLKNLNDNKKIALSVSQATALGF